MNVRAVIRDRESWSPSRWHSAHYGLDKYAEHNIWRVTPSGIEVRGEGSVRRTKGEPVTLRRIVKSYGKHIDAAGAALGVPPQIIAAVIAIESRGDPTAERAEPHLKDVSIGLTQTLTATASFLARRSPEAFAHLSVSTLTPLPKGGDIAAWRKALRNENTSILLGAFYLSIVNVDNDLQLDPVLCYAAFNAGGVYYKTDDPWGLRNYDPDGKGPNPGAIDGFSRWYGDACCVYKEAT